MIADTISTFQKHIYKVSGLSLCLGVFVGWWRGGVDISSWKSVIAFRSFIMHLLSEDFLGINGFG